MKVSAYMLYVWEDCTWKQVTFRHTNIEHVLWYRRLLQGRRLCTALSYEVVEVRS